MMSLDQDQCDMSKPFNIMINDEEGTFIEAFTTSPDGNSMVISGMDLSGIDEEDQYEVGTFSHKATW
jgi:hypothetical protein